MDSISVEKRAYSTTEQRKAQIYEKLTT